MSLIFDKKYKLDKSENFDEYMKALDIGAVKRYSANQAKPEVELTKTEAGELVLRSKSSFKNTSITFKLNEEFDETTPDGRKVVSIISQDGNKLVHVQKCGMHSDTTIIREFSPDQLKMILTIDDIICTRIYKPIN